MKNFLVVATLVLSGLAAQAGLALVLMINQFHLSLIAHSSKLKKCITIQSSR